MLRNRNLKAALLSALALSTAFWAGPADAAYRRFTGVGATADEARDIAIDAGGNVYIVGSAYRGALSKHDLTIRKYTAGGMLIWTKYWAGSPTSKDHGMAIAIDPATNDVYAVGSSDLGTGNKQDIVIVKYSAAGVFGGSYRYNGPGNGDDVPVGIGIADYQGVAGNEVYVIGNADNGPGTYGDIIGLSVSNAFMLCWNTLYSSGIGGDDKANTMVGAGRNTMRAGAHLYAGGSTETAAGDTDILVVGFNPVTGGIAGSWTYGGANDDWLMDGDADNNGVYFTGSYYHPTEAYEIFTVGFTAMGTNYGGSHRWAGPYDDFGVDVECNNWNVIWVAGDSPSSCMVPNPDYDIAMHVYNCWNTAAIAPWPHYEDISGMGSDDHTRKLQVVNGEMIVAASTETGGNMDAALFKVTSPVTGRDWLYAYDYAGLSDRANYLQTAPGGNAIFVGGGSAAAASGTDWFAGKHNVVTGALIW
ncbi:MAG: hypothetical protein HONBIEJF_02294 [Fimbriimonadaceae bacterium]|nr:hypothetical protein [Fimbriimonadaceae bacterium]